MTGCPCTTVVQDSAELAGVITRLAVCLAELKSQRLLLRMGYFFGPVTKGYLVIY